MPLTLWYHPFSSFCWKVLIALYEADVPFDPVVVDFGNEDSRNAFLAIWPIGKFPVIRTEGGEMIPESTIINEYLAQHHPVAGLIPGEPDAARTVRLWERFCDFSVELPVQKIVGDRLRPEDAVDPFGVADAHRNQRTAYSVLEDRLQGLNWIGGDSFSMADCAAAPALHYAEMVEPWSDRPALTDYLARLKARPSIARVIGEAAPFLPYFPKPR